MEGHGIKMMAIVFGGMMKVIIGCLVMKKELLMVGLIWVMMEDVFQKYLIKNGNYGMVLIGIMLETKSKSDVAINQKVNSKRIKCYVW